MIALPGLFAYYLLVGRLKRYESFLAHLEAVCTQKLYITIRRAAPRGATISHNALIRMAGTGAAAAAEPVPC